MEHEINHLSELAEKMRNADAAQLTKEELLAWASRLEQTVAALKPSADKTKKVRVAEVSGAPDSGKIEERQRKPLSSSTSPVKLQNLSVCITSVLDAVREETRCDAVSLCVSHRGLEDEFRCLCSLSNHSNHLVVGSGLVRGTNTLEYACFRSGYFIHAGPKAVLTAENGVSTDCITFLEMMEKPLPNGKAPPPAPSSKFRICCPVKTSDSSNVIGVVTVSYHGSKAYTCDLENYIFDAACILGNLLRMCNDYAALQTCFAKGGQRESLPPRPALSAHDVPVRKEQLIYRVQVNPDDPGDSIRVAASEGGTKKLREGTPITTIFQYMRTLQDSWSSSVKLNVELRRLCSEKESQIFALLSQNRKLEGASAKESSSASN
ncbi:hypothetical protein AGDE_12866 [Angomonas deanei]|uniref:Uncharacterized protein n=1 Tax=Angomonas deanei TaxID=59799 RepID=A0A7G2C3N0_9TRYP|nr:hypothetical protein AGDE_12866 [Angomonas deanei]CAD2213343.1 hypothetical protein, conserved [Angomonas deanei]|eukprot:EPY23363.1 hypothetical protein AGDE_12866 [Angomonas deanei]